VEHSPAAGGTGRPCLAANVLVNLISNAVKFTGARAEAKIEIGCAPDGNGETVIFIRDNGAGSIRNTPENYSACSNACTVIPNLRDGIGLANVQRIIHRHGGRCGGSAVDGGATFYFSIPKQNGGVNGN